MQRAVRLVVLMLVCSTVPACRTPVAGLQSAASESDLRAAEAYIAAAVVKQLPDVAAAKPVVARFARALLDERTAQTESGRFVLERFWEVRGKDDGPDKDAFELYLIGEFLTHTNYLLVLQHAAPTLQVTGPVHP